MGRQMEQYMYIKHVAVRDGSIRELRHSAMNNAGERFPHESMACTKTWVLPAVDPQQQNASMSTQ